MVEGPSTPTWGADERTVFVARKVLATYPNLQGGTKFEKAFGSILDKLEQFYSDPNVRCIVIPETLKVAEAVPAKLPRGKGLALIKLVDRLEVVEGSDRGSGSNQDIGAADTTTNAASMMMASSVLSIELGGSNPFEHLELLSSAVILPMLSNPVNQHKWGEMTSQEVSNSFHSLLASTSILCGHIKGETRLPVPPNESTVSSQGDMSTSVSLNDAQGPFSISPLPPAVPPLSPSPLSVNHSHAGAVCNGVKRQQVLESAMMTWTNQIKNILKQDPAAQLSLGGAHPTPTAELEFWQAKAKSLDDIFEQLQTSRVRSVLRALDRSGSTYCPPFARLCKDVFAAKEEAADNARYLRTLQPWVMRLESGGISFPKLAKYFNPLLQVVVLIWKNCKYYNTPPRLVALMRQICNLLISRACQYVSGEEMFRLIDDDEANVVVEQLRSILLVGGAFKRTYLDTRAQVAKECPQNPWRVQNNAIFVRLDRFLERCYDMLDFTEAVLHFSKLSKTDIGNTNGERLTSLLHDISQDFDEAVSRVKAVEYDVTNIDATSFEADFTLFCRSVKDIEWRLSTIIGRALDDSASIYSRFQLLSLFSAPLLSRPTIRNELEGKRIELIQAYGKDLRVVQEIYLSQEDLFIASHRFDGGQFYTGGDGDGVCGGDGDANLSGLPPVSRALSWCRGLVDRAGLPMTKLRQFDAALLDREEAKEVFKAHEVLMASLAEFEAVKIEQWRLEVESASGKKLTLPLLRRDEMNRRLFTNFDPALVRLLREAKCFLLLDLSVPQEALDMFRSTELIRKRTGNLDLIVNTHNAILDRLLPVEKPLVVPYLVEFDRVVERGITSLTWKSGGVGGAESPSSRSAADPIDAFISDAMDKIQNVESIVSTMKTNFAVIEDIVAKWNVPLIERKSKPMEKEDSEAECRNYQSSQLVAMKDSGKNIHSLVKETHNSLGVSNSSADWRCYLQYVNTVVLKGLLAGIETSLSFLLHQMDPKCIQRDGKLPMIQVVLDLARDIDTPSAPVSSSSDPRSTRKQPRWTGLVFTPSLGRTFEGNGLGDMIDGVVGSLMHVSTMFKRLDCEGTYVKELGASPVLNGYISLLSDQRHDAEVGCLRLKKQYENFAYLWTSDLPSYFSEFCRKATTTTVGGCNVLDLEQFDALIKKCKGVQTTLEQFDSIVDVGWLRVDTSPAKRQITACASLKMDTITSHMLRTMFTITRDHSAFVSMVQDGLELKVVDASEGERTDRTNGTETEVEAIVQRSKDDGGDGDSAAPFTSRPKDRLMKIMMVLRDVRKKAETVSELFEPLEDCLQLLKSHGVDLSSSSSSVPAPRDRTALTRSSGGDGGTIGSDIDAMGLQNFLEEAPLVWESVMKQTFKKKEEILPFQNQSVENLKSDLDAFALTIRSFRGDFRSGAPFAFCGECTLAYQTLDEYADKLRDLEARVHAYQELEELFELQQTSYPEVGEMWREMKYLKDVWDFKAMVSLTFDSWRALPWKDLDPESLEGQSRKLRKQLNTMGSQFASLKGWQVCRDVGESIDVMTTVLPLVGELRAESIRPRHWSALARVCNVKVFDPTSSCSRFVLDDLLLLGLDTHKEEIEDIVETAAKELKIERKLTEIDSIWGQMQLEYVPHRDTNVCLPRPSEEVIESIEAHQMELQGIYGMGKFMDHFKGRVLSWQSLLRTVDETLTLWVLVSRLWASLEPIFLGSEDIRSQLPEDTKRFNDIDSDFKQLMKDTTVDAEPKVVDVCSVSGRLDLLCGMREKLELCQKSLNEYLDVKKNIFPRFYFVSSVALLDMLANGTNPSKITRYLGDCYDALADLRFVELEDGTRSRDTVDVMIAKDGEQVELSEPFRMEGELEHYLNHLTEAMRSSLRAILSRALEKAVNWEIETPRHEWLFDYPAQLCITGTQIYWTEETTQALEEYESGQEDAVKRYLQTCNSRLSSLIELVVGDLTAADRTKIISLITMDVHSRDVIGKLIRDKTEGPGAFAWQQQLRFEWDQNSADVDVRICDYHCKYFYEWVGNTGRLVITPLTDRCYITLTMGLKLYLGGAPAGPAGTGKTETTKDLARALAIPCYVFNCSDQMNFQSMADIFRGLCQTGSWGCFDEFNRIPIEVLSVVATQVKTIQDAIVHFSSPENRDEEFRALPAGTPPTKVGTFDFMGDEISLVPTCGFFITMNPGYAGRTELPENLKALFRSCAMIRPDMKLIQENMLMAEGFQTARALSVKFNTLYELSSTLLSKQPHYDWGLRAVKSVLRVAGGMKRANPTLDESQVLMRALRDFNTPKIPSHDIPIFLRLINDLFMGQTVDSRVDESLKERIVRAAKAKNLQHDETFVNKTCNFQELLDVRHSVMLLGPAGCGKTTIWKTLQDAHNLDCGDTGNHHSRRVCVAETVNPKSVTGNELYGYMTLAKDWKDGVLSIIMRGMSKSIAQQGFHDFQTSKWVVLDGDIDAVWIESMNTVMDDNKVLTLVSNERIPLSPSMRMVFEINSLMNATPATVSRAGILYINETDIGWRPFVETWIQRLDGETTSSVEKSTLPSLFDRYIEPLVEMTRRGYKEVTSVRLINKVQTVVYLLEALLLTIPVQKRTAENIEHMFAFAAMWAFGGPMVVDKSGDYRRSFSEEFAAAFGSKFTTNAGDGSIGGGSSGGSNGGSGSGAGPKPTASTCFEYFFDVESNRHVHWKTKVQRHVPRPIGDGPGQVPFHSLFVETVDSTRVSYLLDRLVRNGRYAMLVGNAGTGKTQVIKNYLSNLDKESDGIVCKNIVMSYYSSSLTLQREMESHIDKRSGSYYGPPMGKKMVFFVDDMNLPYMETYGTQNAIALLTQHIQHGSIFDRSDLGCRKELMDTHYVAAMNPTAGSFEICERCQRHFATFSASMPAASDIDGIFTSILDGHLSKGFSSRVQDLSSKIVQSAIQVQEMVMSNFLPSAVKVMYNWNMRDLRNIFQGLCLAKPDYYTDPTSLLRLYIHETQRVYTDRFVTEDEVAIFHTKFVGIAKSTLGPDVLPAIDALDSGDGGDSEDSDQPSPLVYTNFVHGSMDRAYLPLPTYQKLRHVLDSKLTEYTESNPMMDLVLFEQAMLHVSRICRIIQNPGGHAMLVGVGGSGKQSLCRLAAYINDFQVKQLPISSTFRVEELKEELKGLYTSTGVKGNRIVFLLTDSHIADEEFLVHINAIVTSGWIADLFSKEEVDGILGSIASSAKAEGIVDTPEARLGYFMSRVQKNLRVVLAFSPVGDAFRIRARRFPGLINCTVIDQFHPWPRDALISVAERFLEDVELNITAEEYSGTTDEGGGPATHGVDTTTMRRSLAIHMAQQHLSVAKMSEHYLKTQQRHNYVTPKSYLELISLFKYLLGIKRSGLQRQTDRLDVGLSTLRKTSQDVTELRKDLKLTLERAEEKKVATEGLIQQMAIKREDAKVQQEAAQVEAAKANEESEKANTIEIQAEEELSEAKPAMEAAGSAVDCLSKNMLSELKNLGKPPSGVDKVTNACLILVEKEYTAKKQTWARAKVMMQNVDAFKSKLSAFRGEDITEEEVSMLQKYVSDPDFTQEKMASKSAAAANLCTWVVNIYNFNRIYVRVKPLMDSLEAARRSKADALARLEEAEAKVACVEAILVELGQKLDQAVAEKQEVEEQASALKVKADLAKRLVGGLSSEKVRWGEEIEKLGRRSMTLMGDCMLASGFVSYLGAFDQELREELWKKQWMEDLAHRQIAFTEGHSPLDLLSDNNSNARMISDGFPSDRISLENGAIVANCKRWPLIIDPQGQGIKWLKRKEEGNLDVVQVTQTNWLKTVENAVRNGRCVIIENVGSEIDASLGPVLSRSIFKRGRSLYLKLGEEEIEYDAAFQLYLQTNLSNPHFRPEVAAQCTIINFIATEGGLEEQLLAKVVELERKDLEDRLSSLAQAAIEHQIQLVGLEDDLLERLANAPDDILGDAPLIEGLETTKKTAKEIEQAVEAGRAAQNEVKQARELYRPQAAEGAMLYFLLTKLSAIDHMYQYSLDSFMTFFEKSIARATRRDDDIGAHVTCLRESLRMTIFTWVSRGLFERHKLIFLAQLAFSLMRRGMITASAEGCVGVGDRTSSSWNEEHFQFLTRGPTKIGEANPLSWLPNSAWEAISALCDLEDFGRLKTDLIEASPRFKEWFDSTTPESEKLPLDWASLDKEPLKKMLVVRCLRPDRLIVALTSFIRTSLPAGSSYVDCDSTLNSTEILEQCLLDSTSKTPIYFILSPGANVVADLDVMAAKYGLEKGVSYHNVSMGQGQDTVAMACLESARRNGHWVILNNVQLMPTWLVELEKKLDEYAAEGSHDKFRIFLTSDPSRTIPIGILSRCIKITNEPPSGLKANLKRAWCFFTKDEVEQMDSKTKSILFGLCYFHSIMMERKTFGPMGFNMKYPFSIGDLRDSAKCLQNYMDNSTGGKIPWEDLRYIFGEIMYGGHIVNDYDRLVAQEYLNFYMKEELLDETEMYPFSQDNCSGTGGNAKRRLGGAGSGGGGGGIGSGSSETPSFLSPIPTSFDKYVHHIDTAMTEDTPIAFGLHPNAEIGFRTQQSNSLFRALMGLQPKTNGSCVGNSSSSSSSSSISNPQKIAEVVSNDILDRFGDKHFDTEELMRSFDEQGPYQNVLVQEMEIMNSLLTEIRRSIKELQLGFAGELTMSETMEELMTCLYLDKVPTTWLFWPSVRPLGSWIGNVSDRLAQLEEWGDAQGELPKVTWISGLASPNSFLEAIRQVQAQRQGIPLNELSLHFEVAKSTDEAPREGAFIGGLYLEGARLDDKNMLASSKPKEMYVKLPTLLVKAVAGRMRGGVYHAPLYLNKERGAGFVCEIQLPTKDPPARWCTAGVAAICDQE